MNKPKKKNIIIKIIIIINYFKLKKKKIQFFNKLLFLIIDFQRIINSCEFIEIIIFKDFEVENGVLGLLREIIFCNNKK
jgi:hypothetical protein